MSIRDRFFAWAMSRSERTYNMNLASLKRELLGSLRGEVLELGPGAGPNVPFYHSGVRWVGVEPNVYMHPYLRRAIQTSDRPGAFRIEPGDPVSGRLPAADASLDAVVGTQVLCSVPDVPAMLREILRVLKPGGRYVFIEHVAAPRDSELRRRQDWIQPAWTWVGAGCRPNRETWTDIESAGFARVDLRHFEYADGGLVKPHIAGAAMKAAEEVG